jgi:5-methyltetrahydropteroyltriglutamate--homocysteine methyltransferase
MSVEEFTYLRGRTAKPVKVTLVSAQQAAAYYDPDKSKAAYPSRDSYLADLVDFTRREIKELERLGCEYVQIDAPQYAALLDESIRDGYRKRGSDPDRMIDACLELDNAIIAGHPGMTFGIHICRGNYQSMFYASGGYDRIADRVLSRARFDRFLLEYDDGRSGTFEPLRYVPEDRIVVLGLVSTKKPRVETVDELTTRIDEAARIVPLERLAVSPQCGFASTEEGQPGVSWISDGSSGRRRDGTPRVARFRGRLMAADRVRRAGISIDSRRSTSTSICILTSRRPSTKRPPAFRQGRAGGRPGPRRRCIARATSVASCLRR